MKPKLFESLMQGDQEHRQIYEKLTERAATHPFFKRYLEVGIQEALFSDMAQALGRMHDTLVQAAAPKLIGRQIIKVRASREALERFPLDREAVGYVYAEGACTRLSGAKISTVDIQTNVLAESSEAWTREFAEDASWNVMTNMVEKVGRAVGVKETEKILELYAGIADADLAGGDDIDGGGEVLAWSGLVKLHYAVESENWNPKVLVLHPMQMHQLMLDDTFVNAQYLPAEQTDIEQGVITNVLGMKVVASTLVSNGTAYAIDTDVAALMLLRRDLTVEDWEDPKTGEFGVRATTRFGLGVLRSKAVAKMTNISQTFPAS